VDTVQEQSREEKGRKAIRGAFFGFFVDMFDIYLPVIVLAPAIKYFVSPELSDAETSLVTGAIFAATLTCPAREAVRIPFGEMEAHPSGAWSVHVNVAFGTTCPFVSVTTAVNWMLLPISTVGFWG